MTTPLLEGLDGVEKMSKCTGNYVGVTEPPAEMFGKLMSISDELMWKYYLLLTDLTPDQIDARRRAVESGDLHPKRAKSDLAIDDRSGLPRCPGRRAGRRGVRTPVTRRSAQRSRRAFHARRLAHRAPVARVWTGQVWKRGHAKGAAGRRACQRREVHRGAHRGRSAKGSFLLQVGRQIVRIVVVTPSDVLVTIIPSQDGEAWIIMQNKGQVDVVHPTRESALARAHEVAAASRGRVFVFHDERLREDVAP